MERSTHFAFEHKVFAIDGALFQIAKDTGEVLLYVNLGDIQAALTLESLRREFMIPEESNDAQLLETVKKSLRYVRVIRPGDSIPKELLDGTASWEVTDLHRSIARSRLTLQLISWMTGQEEVISDVDRLQQIANDPRSRQRVQLATTAIAERLGLPPDQKEKITDMVEALARDLAYIEALRSHTRGVTMVLNKIDATMALYRRDKSMLENLQRVRILIQKPIDWFSVQFDNIDAQTGEILNMLKRFNDQIAYIRDSRDDIHFEMLKWEDMINEWKDVQIVMGEKMEKRIREIYHFLASNYPQFREWPLMIKQHQSTSD